MPDATDITTPGFDIRQVTPAEHADSGIGQYAFGASPQPPGKDDDRRWLRYLEPLRLLMSYDAGTPVAKLAVQPMTINVRGAVIPMGGVGGVSTMPAGRRKGHVRALMTRAFQHMHEDGLIVSALYPFRESFYERLGYAGWPQARHTTLTPADLVPLLRVEKPCTFEHLSIAEGYEAWADFLRAYQAECHGFALSHPDNMAGVKEENKHWVVLVREQGEITGAMTYRITGWQGSLLAHTFYPRTAVARYALLEWIGRHADQVKEARVRVAPDALPELWFRDLEAPTSTRDPEAWNAPMGRIVSIEGLEGIPAGDGEVMLEIVDEYCPWNAAVWTLRGTKGELEVEPGGKPTATLTIQGLAALLFTGMEPEALTWRGWGEVDAATAASLRALFPPAVPYLHEEF